MKKSIVSFLVSLLFIASIQAEETRGLTVSLKELGLKENLVGRQYLAIIAVDKYEQWLPLKNPVKDAKELKNILTSRYYIDDLFELYDKEATKANIMKLFEKLVSRLTVKDSLLILYAGHGYLDTLTDTGFWIPVNGGTDVYAQENWLPNSQIRGIVSRLKASHICLIADACFSGDILNSSRGLSPKIDNDYFKKAYERTSRQVLTSGASEAVPDRSEFCRLLKMALEKNENPYLDPVMLYNEIRLGVKDTLPMSGNLKETGHQDGASFLLFLKPEKQEARTAEAPAPISPMKAAQPTPAAAPAEAPAAQSPAAAVKAPEKERTQALEKTVNVSALVGWQNTHIVIAKGDRVRIVYVSGKWRTSDDPADFINAGGAKRTWPQCPFPDAPVGCLLGRIGADHPFVVGNLYEITETDREGELHLRINDGDQSFGDNFGSLKIRVVVDRVTDTVAAPETKDKQALEKSFSFLMEYEGRKYYVSKGSALWNRAKQISEENGGHLVTILSAKENKALTSALSAHGLANYDIWIGLKKENGTWRWVTGETLAYSNWEGGEPNNAEGQEEVGQLWSGHSFRWNDAAKRLGLKYILEIE